MAGKPRTPRPIASCASCGVTFEPNYKQVESAKKGMRNYCSKPCMERGRTTRTDRAAAIEWARAHPDVSAKQAASTLGIPYPTVLSWYRREGLHIRYWGERKTSQTCGYCGITFMPTGGQWHGRKKCSEQYCSDECHRKKQSQQAQGVPKLYLRKHGLYSLEMEQVKQLRKDIYNFINEGAKHD